MIRERQEYLSLKQAAEYLGIGDSTAKKNWPTWEQYGVIPSRYPKRTLRFKRSDLDKLMELTKVQGAN